MQAADRLHDLVDEAEDLRAQVESFTRRFRLFSERYSVRSELDWQLNDLEQEASETRMLLRDLFDRVQEETDA